MSVAFRRESDDEHLEPKFERPIPTGPNLVTPRGLEQIAAKVAEVEAQVAALADEDALKAARRDLRYWSTRLATAQVMPPPSGTVVEFGATVTLRHNGKLRTITLVGDDEADPAAGLLSFSAPLARAIMGAEAGESVDFGGKADAVEVLEIGSRDQA
ncbi:MULTISPECIES: GreA/GreB family elongation factor [unclassified Novosphingobium]|uniref:GreA/GreB family elongation factor n=1 Tax=unclassified Novosphingobium TaxID=2644732 RepID=UPI00146B6297|nr:MULTISPECIES: GreA/GreB family elongation factor [unclassified Novosphingobium]NMN04429.1 transcription elongation GreA/GreB family factor [Novosphingobium sp. SG919]NMN85579.1 transcription elongation GreA/GreB family factor [Novosphingobium sp. SG916]